VFVEVAPPQIGLFPIVVEDFEAVRFQDLCKLLCRRPVFAGERKSDIVLELAAGHAEIPPVFHKPAAPALTGC
jgi:hypothetical protein